MQRKLTQLLIISGLLAVGSLNSVAQEKNPRSPGPRPQKPGPGELKVPTDGTFKVLASKPAFAKVVKGAPYSATATTETTQTLSDGNQIIRKNQSKLYRDSEGRTRIEQTLETIGKWTAEGEPSHLIHINDPVTGFYYDLDPRTQTAIKGGGNKERLAAINEKLALMQKYEAWENETPVAKTVKALELKQEMDKRKQEKLKALEEQGKLKDGSPTDDASLKKAEIVKSKEGTSSDGRVKIESLGKQVIEGVEAEGTRQTLTFSAGEIGNTLPLEIVDETWYSPELQITVMTKHHDPRSGETTYRLTNLNRSEPDRSLFEVPVGYTLNEVSAPKPRRPNNPEEEQGKGASAPKPRRPNNPEEEREN